MAKIKMGFEKQKFQAKYGNRPTVAMVGDRQIRFRSKLEYRWAQHLEFLKMLGEIKDWFFEFHTFYFHNRQKPPYEFTPDFLVRNKDNSFEYYETKGMLQKFDLDKLKLVFEEMPYVKMTIVFWSKPKISIQKKNKLERYCHRAIYDARKMLKNEPIDMN